MHPHCHLVGVWNPSYGADAMDAHVALLLRHARAYRAGEPVDRELVARQRDQLVGVGCKGTLLDLAQVRVT